MLSQVILWIMYQDCRAALYIMCVCVCVCVCVCASDPAFVCFGLLQWCAT